MTNKNEDLADYVRRVRTEKNLSQNMVALNSKRGGLKGISKAYIGQIENRFVVSVTSAKLQALARGLGVPEEEVFAVARGKSVVEDKGFDKSEYALMYSESQKLTPQQRRDYDIAIRIAREMLFRMRGDNEREEDGADKAA